MVCMQRVLKRRTRWRALKARPSPASGSLNVRKANACRAELLKSAPQTAYCRNGGDKMKKTQSVTKEAQCPAPERAVGEKTAGRPVPRGQERMVTQSERDEVEELLQQCHLGQQAEAKRAE